MTTNIADHRLAIAARRLCDEVGHCLQGKDEDVVCAALAGLMVMLPPPMLLALKQHIDALVSNEMALPGEVQSTIDTIVKETA